MVTQTLLTLSTCTRLSRYRCCKGENTLLCGLIYIDKAASWRSYRCEVADEGLLDQVLERGLMKMHVFADILVD